MNSIKELKIGEIVRVKSSGKEMEIVDLPEIYDFDNNKSIKSNKIVCSYFEENNDKNTIVEVNRIDIEPV
ncbi:MAG: hypothetical protein WCK78_09435 [Paludibacter sp.]